MAGGPAARRRHPPRDREARPRPAQPHRLQHQQLRRAREAGQDISAELNPWALFLGNDWNNIVRLGSYALSYRGVDMVFVNKDGRETIAEHLQKNF